jgi:predicted Zn-dependent protease
LEIDPDILAAAMAGSARAPTTDADDRDRLDAWLGEWSREEMVAVLKLITQGQGQDAERSQDPARNLAESGTPCPPRPRQDNVAELSELAKLASGPRLEREAKSVRAAGASAATSAKLICGD